MKRALLFLCSASLWLFPLGLCLAQNGWRPPQHIVALASAKTIYLDVTYAEEALTKNQWDKRQEEVSRLRKTVSQKLKKWCDKGKWCWETVDRKEQADLLLNYSSAQFVASVACVIQRRPGDFSSAKMIVCPRERRDQPHWFPVHQTIQLHSVDDKLLWERSDLCLGYGDSPCLETAEWVISILGNWGEYVQEYVASR